MIGIQGTAEEKVFIVDNERERVQPEASGKVHSRKRK